jgi:UDP-2,3-diacylglucosamine pyrophosphatase LpxH
MSIEKVGAWSLGDGVVPRLNATVNRSEGATLLFLGDLHLDNPKSDRRALKRVLDEAVAREAAVLLLGDVFDAMQGANDRRGSKRDLLARYTGRDDYLSALVEDVAEFLAPYAANIWVLLQGNHESAVAKHYGVHLEQLLGYELRKAGSSCVVPGYQSYAQLGFTFSEGHQNHALVPFWMAHGHGGGGAVTKGVIQAHRRAVTYPDARFVVSGHIHSSYFVAHEQHRLSQSGIPYDVEQEHYVVGAWKNEHVPGSGWWVERGHGPRLPSGWWASFFRQRGTISKESYASANPVRWEFTRAVP